MASKRFVIGLGVGLALGLLIRPKIESERITPERALKDVKKIVSRKHAISGSWIHMQPETVEQNHITYEIYRGGLSTTTEEGTVQYEFLVDTKSGTLLNLQTT